MKTIADYKVGDLIWVFDVNRSMTQQTIEKIGTKLVHTNRNAFSKSTLVEHGQYSHKRLIPDIDAYHHDVRVKRTKSLLGSYFTDHAAAVPLDKLLVICAILEIEPPK